MTPEEQAKLERARKHFAEIQAKRAAIAAAKVPSVPLPEPLTAPADLTKPETIYNATPEQEAKAEVKELFPEAVETGTGDLEFPYKAPEVTPDIKLKNGGIGLRRKGMQVPTRLPKDYMLRWPKLMDLVEIEKKSWEDAFKMVYPELDYYNDKQVAYCLRRWRYNNDRFRQFLVERRKMQEDGKKFPKAKLIKELATIATFNLADLYELDSEGGIQLRSDWLEIAKTRNVLKNVVVTEKTVERKNGDVETTRVTNVSVYSRLDALGQLSSNLGYKPSANSTVKNEQNLTVNISGMIDQVREIARKERDITTSTGKPKELLEAPQEKIAVNEKMIDELMNATVVERRDEDLEAGDL